MTEALPVTAYQPKAIEVYPAEQIEYSQLSAASESGAWSRLKQGIGRIALGLVMATGLYAGGSAVKVATGTEAHTEASRQMEQRRRGAAGRPRFALCNRASQLADKALAAAEKVSKDTGWSIRDGGADAVRHCYWNALMTREFGRPTASGFAWRHEYDENYGTKASKMDLHNNLKGRDWATARDPIKRCIQGVKNSELIRIRKP